MFDRRWLLVHGLILAGILFAATPASAGFLDASWTEPTTNTDGTPLTDLGGYLVYSAAPCVGAFVSVPSLTPTPTGQTVNFQLTGLASGSAYTLSVAAVDTSGNLSACASAAGPITAHASFSVSPTTTGSFGNVNVGSSTTQSFTVQNLRGGTVTGTVSVAAPFSIDTGSSFTVTGTGAQATVTVRFTPTSATLTTMNVNFTADGDSVSRAVTGTGVGSGGGGSSLTVTSMVPDHSAPQPAGTRISFAASATGGTAPLQYKWLVFDGTQFTVAQNWSTNATFAWTPATANMGYAVAVWARSATSTVDGFESPAATGMVAFPITSSFAAQALTDIHAFAATRPALRSEVPGWFALGIANFGGSWSLFWDLYTSNTGGYFVVYQITFNADPRFRFLATAAFDGSQFSGWTQAQ